MGCGIWQRNHLTTQTGSSSLSLPLTIMIKSASLLEPLVLLSYLWCCCGCNQRQDSAQDSTGLDDTAAITTARGNLLKWPAKAVPSAECDPTWSPFLSEGKGLQEAGGAGQKGGSMPNSGKQEVIPAAPARRVSLPCYWGQQLLTAGASWAEAAS